MKITIALVLLLSLVALSSAAKYYYKYQDTTGGDPNCVNGTSTVSFVGNCQVYGTYGSITQCNGTHVLSYAACDSSCTPSSCLSTTATPYQTTCTINNATGLYSINSCVDTLPLATGSVVVTSYTGDASCTDSFTSSISPYQVGSACYANVKYACSSSGLTADYCTDYTCSSCNGSPFSVGQGCNNLQFPPSTTAPYVPISVVPYPPTTSYSSEVSCFGITDAPTVAPTTTVAPTAATIPTSGPSGGGVPVAPVSGAPVAPVAPVAPAVTNAPAPNSSSAILVSFFILFISLAISLF